MSGDRTARILAQFRSGADAVPDTARLCEVCAAVSLMSGAGIMLMSGDLPVGSACTTNDVSALIEELQFTLGEGPCVDAFHEDWPVLEPDLADPITSRWPAFGPPALAAGARAVFGFPLRVGAVRLGALNLYRDRPGPLTDDQYEDALLLAGVAAWAVLAAQANAPPGGLAAELEAAADLRLSVHQATGMVSAQLGVSIAAALIRLRAYAFAIDRPISEVADDVVSRRLTLDDRSGDHQPSP